MNLLPPPPDLETTLQRLRASAGAALEAHRLRIETRGDRTFFTWRETSSHGASEVFFARVDDDGGSLSPRRIATGGCELPEISVEDARVTIAWIERGPAGASVLVAISRDAGATFDEVVFLPPMRPSGDELPETLRDPVGASEAFDAEDLLAVGVDDERRIA